MARIKGHKGKVRAGGTPSVVGEVTEWEFDDAGEKLDASSIGGDFKVSDIGQREVTGTLRAWMDLSDTGQGVLDAMDGVAVALELLPAGSETGDPRFSGNVIVEKLTRRGSVGSLVEIEITWFANAGLAQDTLS